MPHIIVKLWPGRSEEQKQLLAKRITNETMEVLHYGEESISLAIEEVNASEWRDKVYLPDILGRRTHLYKEPGYSINDL